MGIKEAEIKIMKHIDDYDRLRKEEERFLLCGHFLSREDAVHHQNLYAELTLRKEGLWEAYTIVASEGLKADNDEESTLDRLDSRIADDCRRVAEIKADGHEGD